MTEAESTRLARAIRRRFPTVERDRYFSWKSPPLNVLDCVLSLNWNYDRFCLPTVERFTKQRPEVETLAGLRRLINRYVSPAEFSEKELNYRHPARAEILLAVTDYLLRAQRQFTGSTEMRRLRGWAVLARPGDYKTLNIHGFALSGFQYLRMLFGAQTTKPDRHIRTFVGNALGRRVGDVEALTALEAVASKAKLRLRDLDYAIWESLARGNQHGAA
jgi:hypothetical protein